MDHISATQVGLDLNILPTSDADAQSRYDRWKGRDPFPEIDPALLNTADLLDYIATTGMIYPFDPDPSQLEDWLKPASCGIPLGGRYIYWRYEGLGSERKRELVKIDRQLGSDGEVELPANSIVYATLAPTFRLPDYIAARFNLSINFVYRGLLVGTGPLVDPGFQGRLSIPLHNLTAYPCKVMARDAVLWMEFTKLSTNDAWRTKRSQARHGRYVPFPKRKLIRNDVAYYVDRARGGEAIVSSIPKLVEKAAEEARKARQASVRLNWIGGVSLVVALVTILAFVWTVKFGTDENVDHAVDNSRVAVDRVTRLETKLERYERAAGRRSQRTP
jgi:deoxycytidine triphosphate deaminase